MKELNDRIMKDGRSLGNGIIKMDRFLNHQIDPQLMMMAAQELVKVEASGIAPAILIGYLMKLPVVFCKKAQPSTMSDFYCATVHSFTKQKETPIIIAKDYLTPKDHILFIDDVLAFGSAGTGIVESLAIIESLDNNEIRIKTTS